MKIKKSELRSLIESYMLMEITPGVMSDRTTGSSAARYIGAETDFSKMGDSVKLVGNALDKYLRSDPDIINDVAELSLESLNMYFEVSSKLGLFAIIPDLLIETGFAMAGGPVGAAIGAGILLLGPAIVPPVLKLMKTNDPITAGEIIFQLVQDAIDAGFIDIEDIRILSNSGKGALKEQRAGDNPNESSGASSSWFGTKKCFIDTQYPPGHELREVCADMAVTEVIVEAGIFKVIFAVVLIVVAVMICRQVGKLSTEGGKKCFGGIIEVLKRSKNFLMDIYNKLIKPIFTKIKGLVKKGGDDAMKNVDDAVDIPKINQQDTENLKDFQKDSIDAFRKDKNIPAPDLSLLDDALEYDNYISRIKHLDDGVTTSDTLETIQDNLDSVSSHIDSLRRAQLSDATDERVEAALEVAREVKSNLSNKIVMKQR
tara:strand:- start:1660 stop:2946 length:1287 start_codon:yes stop_codon:yes gene_type:complete